MAGKMGPVQMAKAMRRAVELSKQLPELKAEDLLTMSIMRMQVGG